jgi:hypothetical protein
MHTEQRIPVFDISLKSNDRSRNLADTATCALLDSFGHIDEVRIPLRDILTVQGQAHSESQASPVYTANACQDTQSQVRQSKARCSGLPLSCRAAAGKQEYRHVNTKSKQIQIYQELLSKPTVVNLEATDLTFIPTRTLIPFRRTNKHDQHSRESARKILATYSIPMMGRTRIRRILTQL